MKNLEARMPPGRAEFEWLPGFCTGSFTDKYRLRIVCKEGLFGVLSLIHILVLG
jgi:hypothetical protein